MIGHVVLCALASAFGSDGAQAEEVTLAAPAPGAVGANACQLGVAPTSRIWAPVPAVGALTYACPFFKRRCPESTQVLGSVEFSRSALFGCPR